MYYLKLQRLYFCLSYCLIWSLKNLWPFIIRNQAGCGGIPCCDAGRFLYLYLMNCLYNVFVSVSQIGTILPPRLTKGSLIFYLTGLFLISCCHSIGRLCLIWREFKKLHLISYFSLISLWLRKSPFSLIMSCIWTMPFAAQLDHMYGLFEIVYISVFPNSLVVYNFHRWGSDFLKFAPIMECFFI